MPRMLVLTDAETAIGFRLAGVEVRESDAEHAKEALEEVVETGDYGLVVVDEGVLPDPLHAAERMMRGRDLPVLLPLTGLGAAFGEESGDASAYMKELVRSAIGFDIKLE